VAAAAWQEAADELVAVHGLDYGPPAVKWLTGQLPEPEPEPEPEPKPEVSILDDPDSDHSLEGEIRSALDLAAAEKAGFAPAQPIYRRGTKVIKWGVDNARASRIEHEAKPLVSEYCDDLVQQVQDENRRDVLVDVRNIRMNKDGLLALQKQRLLMTGRAFPSLCSRMGFGGGAYLSNNCWPELRAINVNRQAVHFEESERDQAQAQAMEAMREGKEFKFEPRRLNLRVRKNDKGDEVFGVVSPRYTAFDVDKVAKAIKQAMPEEARGTVTYDGFRARFEVMFHSNVKPEKYVAGEFFKTGIIIGTDDTGGGSLWGESVLWQNLCLNLIIIDQAKQGLFRLRHMGSIEALVAKFQEEMTQAKKTVEPFLEKWGYAVEENVIERTSKALEMPLPASIEESMRGIFNGILQRELVPVPGRKKKVVPKLMQMWEKDESAAAGPTRAAVVNAFTRFAHEEPMPSPWFEDEIQRSAGRLVAGAPLPFVAYEA